MFTPTVYDYQNGSGSSRIKLNDTTTDPKNFILTLDSVFDTVVRNTELGLPTDQGMIDYGAKKEKGQIGASVILKADSIAKMHKLIEDFKTAFDPDNCERDTTFTDGFLPLKWSETHYNGSTVISRPYMIYVKCAEIPRIDMNDFEGLTRLSKLTLRAKDPRKYAQTQTESDPNPETVTNNGNTDTPTIITVSQGWTSALVITNSTTGKALTLTVTPPSQTITINSQLKTIIGADGTDYRQYMSGDWIYLNPGANLFSFTNRNTANIVVKHNDAWSL